MTVRKSRRTALVFAMLALGAIALDVPAALAASPVYAKPVVQSAARAHRVENRSTLRASKAQPERHVDDPFASLLLG